MSVKLTFDWKVVWWVLPPRLDMHSVDVALNVVVITPLRMDNTFPF